MSFNKVIFSSAHDNWSTPKDVYDKLNIEFNFNFDPCPLYGSGGLHHKWGSCCFVNPPYSAIKDWIKKGWEVAQGGGQQLYFLYPLVLTLAGGMNML